MQPNSTDWWFWCLMMCQGHDVVILEDLIGSVWRPPVMWVEWYRDYMFVRPEDRFLEVRKWCRIMLLILRNRNWLFHFQGDDYCTPESAKLFQTVIDLGYEIFEPELPLRKFRGCKNKYFEDDLLLIERKILSKWMRRKKVKPPNMDRKYEIELFDAENEEYDIIDNAAYRTWKRSTN